MEKKRANKIIIALICLLLTALTLVGCSSISEELEDKALREDTIELITALMHDDKGTVITILGDSVDVYSFMTTYKALVQLFSTVDTYDFVLVSAYRGFTFENGELCSYSTATYELSSNGDKYIIEVASHSEHDGIYGFYIAPFEMTDYYHVGDITNMVGANWFQWTMLLSNILVLLISLIAFIECCVRKIKLKALWLVLIAIGFFTVGVTVTLDGFRLLFEPTWLLSYTSYITYGGGTEKFRVLIPLGLIVYLCVRKKMIKRREKTELVFPEGDDIYALFRPEPEEASSDDSPSATEQAPSEDDTKENSD